MLVEVPVRIRMFAQGVIIRSVFGIIEESSGDQM